MNKGGFSWKRALGVTKAKEEYLVQQGCRGQNQVEAQGWENGNWWWVFNYRVRNILHFNCSHFCIVLFYIYIKRIQG